jgi:exosortase K
MLMSPERERDRALDLALLGVVALLAAMMKLYYRSATPAALDWILTPTSWLVSKLSGLPFEREQGVGYFNRDARFAILPVCAGVNFFIIAWCSAVYLHLARCTRLRAKLACVVLSTLPCYALTLVANALRIRIAIALHLHPPGLISEARLHEATGVVVYLSALIIASSTAGKLLARIAPRTDELLA